MSGIYIPGMEMPKCKDCFWAFGYRFKCSCSSEQANHDTGTRPSDCPIVSVPDHGRLIDADALAEHKFVCVPHVAVNGEEAGAAYRLGWNTAIEAIMENAETVIGVE